MPSKELYAAARMFLEAQPWAVVGQGGRFAIEGLGADTVYAMVTGGAQRGLTLFMNAQSMASYAAMVSAEHRDTDETEMDSLRLEQDYPFCQFDCPDQAEKEELRAAQKAFPGTELSDVPVCRRLQFARFPRPANEAEEKIIISALKAAADLANNEEYMPHEKGAPTLSARIAEDGSVFWSDVEIPKEMAVGYPSPKLQDELALRRLRRQPGSGAVLNCAVRILPMPLEGEIPHMPVALVMMDDHEGVVGMPMVEDYESEYARFANEFLGYVEEFGKPARIRTADPRTYCLIGELARQLGIPVEQGCSIPEVNDVVRSFLAYIQAGSEEEPKQKGKTKKAAHKNGQGICLLCEKEYSGSGMTRHFKECTKKNRAPGDTEYLLIRVSDAYDPDFWMYLEVKSDASLKQVDQFLREAWVDCCGHLSAFFIGDEMFCSTCMEAGDRSMNAKLENVIRNGSKFRYEYDFGNTTELKLQVVDQYQAKNRRKKVELLARNIMPVYPCVCCGKPAKLVFRPGGEPVAESVYCAECAENMDQPMLPLINSPRTGVCGYGMWLMDDDFEDDDE